MVSQSSEDQMLNYHLLVAKMAHAVTLACQTTLELMDNNEDSQQNVDHNSKCQGSKDVIATCKFNLPVFVSFD